MKSLKFIVRLALFVLVLFAVAASTHAQQCRGHNPTMYQDPNPGNTSAYNPPSPARGRVYTRLRRSPKATARRTIRRA